MDLKHLTDEALEKDINSLIKTERETLTSLLHHLMENERRRLYSKLKYKSLMDYLIRGKGYSEDEAWRKVDAMRLLKELPEIEEKISKGSLSLTNLTIASSHFKKEAKFAKALSKNEKLDVLTKLTDKSTREAKIITATLSSLQTPEVRDRIKPIAQNLNEITFGASDELVGKLQNLKGLVAHSNPDISLGELIDKLADLGLQKWNPGKKPAAKRDSLRKQVWRKSNSQCENCGSTHALQIDHVWPKALGGNNTLENLRLLCRNCNQRVAMEIFGVSKIESYSLN